MMPAFTTVFVSFSTNTVWSSRLYKCKCKQIHQSSSHQVRKQIGILDAIEIGRKLSPKIGENKTRKEGRKEGRTDGRKDGWTDGRTDGRIFEILTNYY